MATGLYIHILDAVDDQLLSSVDAASETPFLDLSAQPAPNEADGFAGRLTEAPRIFLGEGPWGADEPDAHALPAPLVRIRDGVPPGPVVVDDEYIGRILVPFDRYDETPYRLGRPGEIWRFLRHHEGKPAVLAIHPDETKAAADAVIAEPEAAPEVETAEVTAPAPEPRPEEPPLQPVHHDPTFRRPVPTIDGVRPLALVLVTTQQRAPGPASLRERILAALATIGTFGAGLAAGAGLNTLIR